MATSQGFSRTNYVRFADRAKLDALLAEYADDASTLTVEVCGNYVLYEGTGDNLGKVAFGSPDDNWPSIEDTEVLEAGGDVRLFLQEVAALLADDEIMVVMASGHEGERYVYGWAEAYRNTGECVSVHLEDIYKQALEKWGQTPNPAAY